MTDCCYDTRDFQKVLRPGKNKKCIESKCSSSRQWLPLEYRFLAWTTWRGVFIEIWHNGKNKEKNWKTPVIVQNIKKNQCKQF